MTGYLAQGQTLESQQEEGCGAGRSRVVCPSPLRYVSNSNLLNVF